jgi:hypothetical protein
MPVPKRPFVVDLDDDVAAIVVLYKRRRPRIVSEPPYGSSELLPLLENVVAHLQEMSAPRPPRERSLHASHYIPPPLGNPLAKP